MSTSVRRVQRVIGMVALAAWAAACGTGGTQSTTSGTGATGGSSTTGGGGSGGQACADCTCSPGSTQACYSGPAGTKDVGPCKAGTQTCAADGKGWGACTGEVLPTAETCEDAIDNDCNGKVNDSGPGCLCVPGATQPCYSGPAGTQGVGACKAGTMTCDPLGKAWGACTGEVLPTPEMCGTPVDDDCNGLVNEGGVDCACTPGATQPCYSGPAGTAGVGVCVMGVQTCAADGLSWGTCAGEVTPTPETCLTPEDDDCNGLVNEGGAGCVCVPGATQPCYSGPAGTQNVGACHAGTQTCAADGLAWGACAGEVTPVPETCLTAVDDDCNGQVNEGGAGCVCVPGATQPCYSGPAGTQNVGICKGGTMTCDPLGTAWGACVGEILPQIESCLTTADDDCNGSNLVCPPNQDCLGNGICSDPCSPTALGTSYIGCDYYPSVTPTATAVSKVGPGAVGLHYAVAISNTSTKTATYTITRGSAFSTTGSVAANNIAVVQLPWVPALDANITASVLSTNAGGGGAYHLVSSRPVTVYQYSPLEYTTGLGFSYSADASLLLPTNAWTGNYIVASRNYWGSWPGFYEVVASQAGTQVTVTPSATGKVVLAGGGISSTGTGTVTLNQGDVLQVLCAAAGGSPDASDLTGTLVTANKPIEVFGGHYATDVPYNVIAADHLEEAMLPIQTLSKQYIATTPLINASTPKDHVVRIIATQANTSLAFDPPQAGWPTTIANVGQYVEVGPTPASFKVTASQKVMVVQYMLGEAYGGGAGDPAMALAVPVEQYRTNYLFHAPTNYESNYVNITAPTGAPVTLDGVAVPAANFVAIGSSGYSLARAQLSNAGTGDHTVTSPAKIGISVYGYGQYTSFWYPGGLDLALIP